MKQIYYIITSLILCVCHVSAQNGSSERDIPKSDKKYRHSIGITNGIHYDLLKEANNMNHLARQDNNINWTLRLFYELNYRNFLALEVGLNILTNTSSEYTGHIGDSLQRKVSLEISRGIPQIFFNTKLYPLKTMKSYFIGIGYTRIKAHYGSAATNPAFNHIDYDNTSNISNLLIFTTGKEFRYKNIRGDVRLSYFQHMHFKSVENDLLPAIIFLDANFNEHRSHYWYNAIELGVTFIL